MCQLNTVTKELSTHLPPKKSIMAIGFTYDIMSVDVNGENHVEIHEWHRKRDGKDSE
jgi:hypothetical protein